MYIYCRSGVYIMSVRCISTVYKVIISICQVYIVLSVRYIYTVCQAYIYCLLAVYVLSKRFIWYVCQVYMYYLFGVYIMSFRCIYSVYVLFVSCIDTVCQQGFTKWLSWLSEITETPIYHGNFSLKIMYKMPKKGYFGPNKFLSQKQVIVTEKLSVI